MGEESIRHRDAVSNQLARHAEAVSSGYQAPPVLRASNGVPVDTLTASMTAGPKHGPIVLKDFTLIDHLAHFDRERIPERVVHAKGAGAFGYFQVTTNFASTICKARMFSQVGLKTSVAVRFSTVGGESGSADTARDPRGFAVKFYTEEGNWDLVGNNTPIFFIRDPILFPSFIHTQKRNPQTHCKDPDMFWDFIGLRPETVHQVSFLFSDRGTPDGYRHMNGYGSHTFCNVNAAGEMVYVKYHLKTDQGIRNLSAADADRIAGEDPDYATRDLFNAIANGDFPSWTLYVQVMTPAQVKACPFDPFDLTKIWSHATYPLQEVGRMYLNRNPTDYFAEVEQLAFAPSHLIPGIEPSPDKMLQARLFSYPDTHRHRLGTNYQSIPVNRPLHGADSHGYQRDGPMQVTMNGAGGPNYAPNSFMGPAPPANATQTLSWYGETVSGTIQRVETREIDNFGQCRNFFRNVLDAPARERLTDNIAGHLQNAQPFLRKRVIHNFSQVDPSYGQMLETKVALLLAKKQRSNDTVTTSTGSAAPLNPPRYVPKVAGTPFGHQQQTKCPYGYSSKL